MKMTNGKSFSLSVTITHYFSWGSDEGSRTLIVRFTRPTLCYPVELHRHLKIGGLEGSQTLTRSLQDFYAVSYITGPKKMVAVGGVEPPTFRL